MNAPFAAPQPDKAAILGALAAMFDSEDVIELRAFHKGKKRTDAGYFDGGHRQDLADAAAQLNAAGAAVYVTLNRIDPQLLARYCNRVEGFAQDTATDANVKARRWLLIDLDPVRPKNTAATEAQLNAAKERATVCYRLLKAQGWPEPLAGESGNGWHLIYPLDLPNDDESRELVKHALAGLAARLDDGAVKVDQSVFNAGRITKLYGTVANKGDHTPMAPWRLSRLVSAPKRGEVVTPGQLRALHPAKPEIRPPGRPENRDLGTFDLSAFLSRLGIPYDHDMHEGRDRYRLAHCPFNPEHGRGEAAIFQAADGRLGFKCQHNSCADKGWHDVRALVDGPGEPRTERATEGATAPGRGRHQPGEENAPAGRPDGDGWPDPTPLPKLPPVPDFPADLLPDDLVAWVGDASERARFRPDFAAVASMAALGSVIGRKLGIRLKQHDDWTEYANVWGALIGPPSALKSPAMRAAMRPFKALQAARDERHQEAADEHAAQLEAFKLRKEAKKKAAVKTLTKNGDATIDLGDISPPDAPVVRTYWTSDATAERLGELLAENPNGLLVERDELSSLLVTLEDDRNATARGLYLSGWSGHEGYRFDRIMRGTTTLPKFALSVVGGIQPGPLARYVRGAFSGDRADGLLQRFQLAVWPDPAPFEYVDRFPDGPARNAASALFEQADTFDPEVIGSHDDFGNNPPFIRLSPAAQRLFVEWYPAFMCDRRTVETGDGESAPIAVHFGKYPGLVGKLALILHVADDPGAKVVSERTMLKALAWIDYLAPHARRVYHAVEHPETGAAELLLSRLRRGDLPASFKAWEVSRKGWHGLTDREAVKKACRLLFEYGWLIEIDPGGGQGIGRPADPVYAVSPAAKVTP